MGKAAGKKGKKKKKNPKTLGRFRTQITLQVCSFGGA